MTYQANQSEEAKALLPRIDAAIQRIVNGQGCMRIPADIEDPDLVLADCKKLLKALAALPPQAKAEPAGVSDEAEFDLHCDGDYAASAFGPRASAWAEIQRYAAQYRQDGPVVIYEVTRTELDAEGRAILSAAPSTGVREDETNSKGGA